MQSIIDQIITVKINDDQGQKYSFIIREQLLPSIIKTEENHNPNPIKTRQKNRLIIQINNKIKLLGEQNKPNRW